MKNNSQIKILLLCILSNSLLCCLLSNKQLGQCLISSHLPVTSFCSSYISSYVCFPQNRITWANNNLAYRDQLVEDLFMKNLEQKLVHQYTNPTGTNIVSNNIDCYYAYRNFICSWNFPACNSLTNLTKAPCRSVCVSFFSNCQGNTQICDVVYQTKDIGLDITC